MELGFETVGNATLICHDNGPVLVTDPWLDGPAYFGSWGLSHRIPDEQLAAIEASPNLWISHGHPDHLSFDSLLRLRDKNVFVSDHVGNRIADFLTECGFRTTILRDRQWVEVSPRVHIQSLAHFNQDSILLVDIDGTLIIDMNDTPSTVWQRYIKRLAGQYRKVVLLRWSGWGDAENNLFDESGQQITPAAASRPAVGEAIARQMKHYGADLAIPFSSLHRYQRSDSSWANGLLPQLPDYPTGFDPRAGELLPAFVSYDVIGHDYTELPREALPEDVFSPAAFGDDWSEPLTREDVVAVRSYFERRPVLGRHLDFVRLLVGGEDHIIRWSTRERAGVTFEVPRASLLTAIKYAVFDDLFIGNFMKITFHGTAEAGVRPAINPYLGKWADNGLAESSSQVRAYLKEYRRRAPLPYLFGRLDDRAKYAVKAHVSRDTTAYEFLRRLRTTVRA
jgi:hypothetical protein